jgi:Sulfotransferase domain
MSSRQRPRIFGIGLTKTGTASLHAALELLDYRSLHWGGFETLAEVCRAIDESRPMLDYLDPELDAFSDIFAITHYFYLADVQYPGSKFILTVRDLEQWLDSRRRHVERNQQMRAAGEYSEDVEVDIDGWATEHRRHEAVVRGYFANRPDNLLVLDITAGDGWEPLCAFLGRALPEAPFPHENRFRPWTGAVQARVGSR